MEKKDHIYQCRGFNESIREREIWCGNVGGTAIYYLAKGFTKQTVQEGWGGAQQCGAESRNLWLGIGPGYNFRDTDL